MSNLKKKLKKNICNLILCSKCESFKKNKINYYFTVVQYKNNYYSMHFATISDNFSTLCFAFRAGGIMKE